MFLVSNENMGLCLYIILILGTKIVSILKWLIFRTSLYFLQYRTQRKQARPPSIPLLKGGRPFCITFSSKSNFKNLNINRIIQNTVQHQGNVLKGLLHFCSPKFSQLKKSKCKQLLFLPTNIY